MATIRKTAKAFQLDFYLYGKRFRKNFETLNEAPDFKSLIEAKVLVKETTLQTAIDHYLKEETSQKRTKFSTEALYFWELKKYLKEAHEISPQSFVSEIRPLYMRGVQNWLRSSDRPGKPISASTVNRRFNTIKHFFGCCLEWEMIKEHPCRFIRSLTEKPRIRKAWTEEQISILKGHLKPAELLVFDFLLETGARLSSAVLLEWQEVDFENELITFRSRKGARSLEKLYSVPMSKRALLILKNREPKQKGRVFDLHAALFSKQVNRMIKKAGLSGLGLTLHGLRHTFASRLHKKGASTESIRRLLGHSTTKTTQGYLHSEIDHLRALIS